MALPIPAGSSQTTMIETYVVDAVGVVGFIVGMFRPALKHTIDSTSQQVIVAASSLILLGINGFRLAAKGKIATAVIGTALPPAPVTYGGNPPSAAPVPPLV